METASVRLAVGAWRWSGGGRLDRFLPPRAELVDLAKNPFPLACVLAGGGGGKLGLQLLHFLLAVIAAIQLDSAFDHLSKSPESRPTRRRRQRGWTRLLSMDLSFDGEGSSWQEPQAKANRPLIRQPGGRHEERVEVQEVSRHQC